MQYKIIVKQDSIIPVLDDSIKKRLEQISRKQVEEQRNDCYKVNLSHYGIQGFSSLYLFQKIKNILLNKGSIEDFIRRYEISFEPVIPGFGKGDGIFVSRRILQQDGIYFPPHVYKYSADNTRQKINFFSGDCINVFCGECFDNNDYYKFACGYLKKDWSAEDLSDPKTVDICIELAKHYLHISIYEFYYSEDGTKVDPELLELGSIIFKYYSQIVKYPLNGKVIKEQLSSPYGAYPILKKKP
ncbi:hypothetical protein ACFL57_00980 [Candidatus Margulisiibacteriota bacterium]